MISGAIANDALTAWSQAANSQPRSLRGLARTPTAGNSTSATSTSPSPDNSQPTLQARRSPDIQLYNAQGRVIGQSAAATQSKPTAGAGEKSGVATSTASKPDSAASQDTDQAGKSDQQATDLSRPTKPDGKPVSDAELRQIRNLERIDREVHQHEMSHSAVGGRYAGGANYGYDIGPDGKRYATSGEVGIDVSPVAGDPRATIRKMAQVAAAALAPADPSAADRRIAATARQQMMQAQAELATADPNKKDGTASSSAPSPKDSAQPDTHEEATQP